MTIAADRGSDRAITAHGRAMGCRVHVTVSARPEVVDRLLAGAFTRLRHLEEHWSRFLPDSDVSRLNRADGRWTSVDPSTVVLVREMAAGVRSTTGAFDPTLLVGVVGLGVAAAWDRHGDRAATTTDRSAWIDETAVDPDGPQIRLPAGLQLDAGAIGKGLAADLVAAELAAGGATGARVAVGGDLRVLMPSTIEVQSPSWTGAIDHIAIAAGGVATSGTGRSAGGGRRRLGGPVVDPRTSRPVDRPAAADIVQVTVAAATAAQAEVLATAVLVDGDRCPDDGDDDLDARGIGVLAVRADGGVVANSSWRALRVSREPASLSP